MQIDARTVICDTYNSAADDHRELVQLNCVRAREQSAKIVRLSKTKCSGSCRSRAEVSNRLIGLASVAAI